MSARRLVQILVEPAAAPSLTDADWMGVLTVARGERLLGSLAKRLADARALPPRVADWLERSRLDIAVTQTRARWEVEMARRALASAQEPAAQHSSLPATGIPMILLKGSAYVVCGLDAGSGREVGDLDILVAHKDLPAVEAALNKHGWEGIKTDPYDQEYYRRWMHELPPLIHQERDALIDVHHTILPLTARPRPDANALIAAAVMIEPGVFILCPEDMVVHAAAHLIADGEMEGALRNLWDIDRLIRQFSTDEPKLGPVDFGQRLMARARHHQLDAAVARAWRLAGALYRTPGAPSLKPTDGPFLRRALARAGDGRKTHRLLRLGFAMRGHWLRMPPLMLARHLGTKWMRTNRKQTGG